MKTTIKLLLLSVLIFISCKTNYKTQKAVNETEKETEFQIPVREYSVQSVLWQQLSAEYKALCFQAFNIAKLQLDKAIEENKNSNKPLAIVTDIDETLVDNSPFNAKMIKDNVEYHKENWIKWGKLEAATAIPGALEFLKYANSKGVQIFYISNRYKIEEPETLRNLAKLGFPNVDTTYIFLKTTTSGKEQRRQKVLENNNIVMLLGDNLSDFSMLFDKKGTKERDLLVNKFKNEFGKRFIVLPNPMYGDWETKGLYEGSYKWTPLQKDSIRKFKLRTY